MNDRVAHGLRLSPTRTMRTCRASNRYRSCRRLLANGFWRTSLLGAVIPAGCSHAPSQNILGSFFPSWMLCTLIGIAAAAASRLVLGAAGLDRHVPAAPLAYLAVAVAVTLFAWLIQFGQ